MSGSWTRGGVALALTLGLYACGDDTTETSSASGSESESSASTSDTTGSATGTASASGTETTAVGTESETGSGTTAGPTSASSDATDATDPTDPTGSSSSDTDGTGPGSTTDPTETGTDSGMGTDTGGLCGDEFTDPHGDGSLQLSGDEVFVLGPGPYDLSWICVKDNARLLVCDETTINLSGGNASVIGGGGLGPALDNPITVNLNMPPGIEELYIFFDATEQMIEMVIEALDADITYALIGMSGVSIMGNNPMGSATYEAGPPNPPPCP